METSQPLSIESFSYSWLVNLRPSLLESLESSLRTSLDASDEASFIEMDPKSLPLKDSLRTHRTPNLTSQFHSPLLLLSMQMNSFPMATSCLFLLNHCKWKNTSPLTPTQARRLRGHKSSTETAAKRGLSVKNRRYYSDTSPRISVALSADDWRYSCDSESSIYEAVLHCKRSIGNERMSQGSFKMEGRR
ncbi:hypothetical protein ACSQ67_024413 [Phaseolus vulgaris]